MPKMWYQQFENIVGNQNGILLFSVIEKLEREEFEDTKGVVRIRTSKDTMAKRKRTKGQKTIYKTLLYIILMILYKHIWHKDLTCNRYKQDL